MSRVIRTRWKRRITQNQGLVTIKPVHVIGNYLMEGVVKKIGNSIANMELVEMGALIHINH